MAILNKTGITNGSTIQAEHVTRTIDALTGVSTDTIIATGSFTGSFTGPLTGTASFATSASRAVSSSFATTSSYALNAVGAGSEYMTLRLSSGLITGVVTDQPIYIGINGTSSATDRNGIMLPYNCTIVSASIYTNSLILTNSSLTTVRLYNNVINDELSVIGEFNDLDVNQYLDATSSAISSEGIGGQWINVGVTPVSTATGSFVIASDILIKKS